MSKGGGARSRPTEQMRSRAFGEPTMAVLEIAPLRNGGSATDTRHRPYRRRSQPTLGFGAIPSLAGAGANAPSPPNRALAAMTAQRSIDTRHSPRQDGEVPGSTSADR